MSESQLHFQGNEAAPTTPDLRTQQNVQYLSQATVVNDPDLPFSAPWLERARWAGNGPPYRKIGRKVYYEKGELIRWIEGHRRTSTSDDGSAA